MSEYDERTLHWLDTLDHEERERARRILAMPGGTMAVAWVGVELYQLRKAVLSQNGHGPNGRTQTALAAIGGAVGSGITGGAVFMARLLGVL